jgi:hypothetical protein
MKVEKAAVGRARKVGRSGTKCVIRLRGGREEGKSQAVIFTLWHGRVNPQVFRYLDVKKWLSRKA